LRVADYDRLTMAAKQREQSLSATLRQLLVPTLRMKT
jgi:hypothetical protein